jgi:signal transduction histidine kinase/streptogramin lyase
VKLDLLRPSADISFPRFGRFDGQRFDWFEPASPFHFGWVGEQTIMQTRDSEWWVGGGAGLYRFPASGSFASIKTARPLALYATKDGLAHPQVWRVFADSAGNVWVATFYGLARWDRASQTMHDLANSPNLPSISPTGELARSFGEDRAGNIWIGFSTGVARYCDGRFTFFSASDGLPPGAIESLYSDRAGRLWLASSRGGLIRIDDPAAERPTFKSYTTAQGLSANGAAVITEDLYERIYVATGRGLDQLDPETDRVKHFTTADGLAPGSILAAFRDRTGALWFGTARGLSRFVPAPATPAPPPLILITGLRVGGERRSVSALGETGIALADLAPDRNQLQIDFVALGFAPGEVLRYQYRLEGSDADWGALSAQRTVNYASLAPGRYRFLVRAVNSDGVASSSPATVTFTILRPVWQRWWFVSLAALGVGLTAVAFYRSRVKRIVELERMRTRIATDLHDDIGSSLSQIAILSEVSRQRLGERQNGVGESLAQIANTSRDLVDSMSDIVWAINPRRDRVSDLTQRMREFAGDVFTAREIEFSFHAPAAGLEIKLEADLRRQLYLIFKEAVNNAARHSGCTQAEIEFEVAPDRLLLHVRDNGRSFDPNGDAATSRNGNGLASMCERARALGGEIEINSQPNQGTAIKLNLPLSRRWRR